MNGGTRFPRWYRRSDRFPHRFWRLYRYFRGHLGNTLYAANGYACGRKKSVRLAWRYALKGGGRYV